MISLISGLSHKNELEGFHGRQFWNPHNILELTEVIPQMVQKVKLLFGSRGVCLNEATNIQTHSTTLKNDYYSWCDAQPDSPGHRLQGHAQAGH